MLISVISPPIQHYSSDRICLLSASTYSRRCYWLLGGSWANGLDESITPAIGRLLSLDTAFGSTDAPNSAPYIPQMITCKPLCWPRKRFSLAAFTALIRHTLPAESTVEIWGSESTLGRGKVRSGMTLPLRG